MTGCGGGKNGGEAKGAWRKASSVRRRTLKFKFGRAEITQRRRGGSSLVVARDYLFITKQFELGFWIPAFSTAVVVNPD